MNQINKKEKEKDSVLLSRSSSFNDSHCKSDCSSKNSRDKLGIHQITSWKKMSRRSIVPVGDCFDDGHCTSNSSGKNGSDELSIHKTYLLNKWKSWDGCVWKGQSANRPEPEIASVNDHLDDYLDNILDNRIHTLTSWVAVGFRPCLNIL